MNERLWMGGWQAKATDRPNRTFTLYVGQYEIKLLSRASTADGKAKPMLT